MKITLHCATSLDGFIARQNGSFSWVKDHKEWLAECQKYDGVIMGSNTYEKNGVIQGVANFIFSHDQSKQSNENVFFVHETPEAFIRNLDDKYQNLMVAGGGALNTSFLEAGLINELILSVHPTWVGEGIKLFQNELDFHQFERLDAKTLHDGIVRLHLRV